MIHKSIRLFLINLYWYYPLVLTGTSLGDDSIKLDAERLQQTTATFESTCAMCHDSDGTAMGEIRLNLVDEKWNHGSKLADIEKTIREGVPSTTMKPQQEKLSAEEIADLAKYVLLLAKTHEPTEKAKPAAATEPAIEYANFIDQYIFDKLRTHDIPHAKPCTDREFVRRLHLDLWGRLPDSDQVREFLKNTDPKKRNKLVDELLGLDDTHEPRDKDYKAPWMVGEPFLSKWRYFFEDLFRNYDECGLNISNFRDYLYGFLKSNIPYDVVVREMLTATAVSKATSGAAGLLIRQAAFSGGHEDVCDQNALYVTRNFLGVNLQCISCHHGKNHLEQTNLWLTSKTRVDFWQQAAFFGNTRIFRPGGTRYYVMFDGVLPRPDKLAGGNKAASMERRQGLAAFEFSSVPDNDSIQTDYRMDAPSKLRIARDPQAEVFPAFILDGSTPVPGKNPREELARMITSSQQFAKVTVNLIWAQLMTVGIVDPPLDWDLARQDPEKPPPEPWTLQPSHPKLLEALAKAFQENHFDLRWLMRTICRSNAYQLSSSFEGDYQPEYDRFYARKLVRRLWAQEIYDAILKATTVDVKEEDYMMNSPGPVRNNDKDISQFLNFFGLGNRDTKDADTSSISILQAASMLNSSVVKKRVAANLPGSRTNKLLQEFPPWTWSDPEKPGPEKIVEEMYLSTLSRLPTESEKAESIAHLQQYRDLGVEDLQWALLNQLEFIVNQ